MLTKDEITEKLFEMVYMVADTGFFMPEELVVIDALESMYYTIKKTEREEE